MIFATDVSREDQGVSKLGVTWNIAKDRRIENDGGLYQPEGLDKYMRRLIDELSARIDRLAEQNAVLEQKIDQLLEQSESKEQEKSVSLSRAEFTGSPLSTGKKI